MAAPVACSGDMYPTVPSSSPTEVPACVASCAPSLLVPRSQLGQAEIQDLHQSIGCHHHVLWFEIPVHDSSGVRLGQSFRDLRTNPEHGGDR